MTPHAATSNPPTAHILRAQIHYHLDNDLLDTAAFLAARLHALDSRNPDSHHLLALTSLRQRRFKAAADFAQKYGANGRHLGCAYVFAQACLHIARCTEGVNALEKCRNAWAGRSNWSVYSSSTGETPRRSVLPDAAACWTLLGKLWRAHGDMRKSGDAFIEAHKANPFLWDAFDGLCKVGADLDVNKMFRPTVEMMGGVVPSSQTSSAHTTSAEIYMDEVVPSSQQEASRPLGPQLNFNQQLCTPTADPFVTSMKPLSDAAAQFVLPRGYKAPLSEWDTPTANTSSGVFDEDVAMGGVVLDSQSILVPGAPPRRPRPPLDATRQRSQTTETSGEDVAPAQQQRRPTVPGVGTHKRTISGHQHATSQIPTSSASTAGQGVDLNNTTAPVRRSNRLYGQAATVKSTTASNRTITSGAAGERPAKPAMGTKGRIGSTVGRVVSGNRKMLPPDRNEKEKEPMKRAPSRSGGGIEKISTVSAPVANATERPVAQAQKPQAEPPSDERDTIAVDQEAVTSLMSQLRELALGTYSTTRFDTTTAIRTLRPLRENPYVLAQLGKAYYEAGSYKESEEAFARCLKLQPSRTEDMEVYSTVLWHLKKDAALAYLCWNLREIDSNAPETWVATGNAFSLAREHDQAIAAFQRAVQVDPNFAYAWTLIGHEYIANEEYDHALRAFRHAVSVDRRAYGGWYGLGRSYERLGKLDDAEKHYRIAAGINPSNSTLYVCIGVVQEKLRHRRNALLNYNKALELSPASALARFKKARVLMHMREFDEALKELEILKDQAPDEANVWFLLGKCYKGLGDRGDALKALTTALNLDAKAAPFIKEAMEALDEDEGMESEEE